MIDDQELEALPRDPDEAATYIVKRLRAKLHNFERKDSSAPLYNREKREYVNKIQAATDEYGVKIDQRALVEPPIDVDAFEDFFHTFNVVVYQYVATHRSSHIA